MALTDDQVQLRKETEKVLLELIQDSAGKVNRTNGDYVRALAEAYAWVVRPAHASSSA